MNYWQDKVVIITGGSAGLGLALAKESHRQGARVVLVARDEARLQKAVAEIGGEAEVQAIPADITDQQQVDALFARIDDELGRIDMLINCAGKSARGEILDTTPANFRDLIELNFLAVVRCTRAALPQLRRTRGHLVHIGSLASKSAARFLGAYPASKFPVAAYAQQLRLELSSEGVHVLLVCPGPLARVDAGSRYADTTVPHSAQQPGGGVKLKGIDPTWLSKRILGACERRKAELIVPAKARILFALSQLSPRLGDWILRRMTT